MADPNLIFDPPTGHNDTTVFPTNPSKETVRGLMQRLHDQTRDFINGTFLTWIKATFASKTEVNNVVLGQIPDGSLTDIKLSDEAGQIKDTVTTHLADIADKTDDTKGAALIGLKPVDGLTGDNVRTAIQNLFQFANNGKTGIANAITAKGVTANPTDTFSVLADKIGQLGADYAKYKNFNYVPSAYPRKITSEGIWCGFGMTTGCKLYDINGTLLFTHSISQRFFDYLSDSEMIFGDASNIWIYSRTGTQIKTFSPGYIPCFAVGNGLKYYIAENGTTNLKVYDKNFTLLKTITLPFTAVFPMTGKADDKKVVIQNSYDRYYYIDVLTDTIATSLIPPVLL